MLRLHQITSDGHKKPHTLASIHASIEEACQSLEAQIAEIEDQSTTSMAEVQDVVGALSDLRHGRFAQPASGDDIGAEVLVSLRRLEKVCSAPKG